jgi:3-hydroxyacyl-[acyl-carrier-protein] dehydratase
MEINPEDYLPHRKPMLLVDKVIEIGVDSIECSKLFSEDEFFLKGHYPGSPIVPGVILVEAAVQAGAILISHGMAGKVGGVPVLTRLNEVRFKQMVKPGDEVELHARLDEEISGAYFMSAKVVVDKKVAARFSFACTLVQNKD